MNLNLLFFRMIGVVATLSICVCSAKADVEIAVMRPLSGTSAGQTTRDMEYAVGVINDLGGLLGQKLHLAYFDDGCEADLGEAAARRALAEHPRLILGHQCSAASIRAAPLYADAHVIQISITSTNSALTDMNIKSLFRMVGRNDAQGVVAADLIARRWPDAKVGVIDDGESYGAELALNLCKSLAARHLTIAFRRQYEPDAPSYADIAEAVRHNHLDVLYIAGYAEDIGLILHDMRGIGLKTQVLSGDAGGNDRVIRVAHQAAEGMLFTDSRDPLSYHSVVKLIAEAHAKGLMMDGNSAINYAAIELWADAVRQAGSFDFDKVVAVMHAQTFETVIGRLAFDAKGDVIGSRGDWIWYRWHDGATQPDAVL